jgi:hypothetical protein
MFLGFLGFIIEVVIVLAIARLIAEITIAWLRFVCYIVLIYLALSIFGILFIPLPFPFFFFWW